MASKHGKGSIVQLDKGKDGRKPKAKCRKWRLVVSLGKDPSTGKYPQKSRAFHGSYTEAEKALREFVEEIEGGNVVKKNSWTYNEYAEHYLKLRDASGEFAAKTNRSTKVDLAGLGYLIGELKMQDITPCVLESAAIDLKSGKSRSGRNLTGTTVRAYFKAATCMFKHAKKAGVIGENPFDEIQKPKSDTKEKLSMNRDDYGKMLDALDPEDGMQIAVLLCATLGLRRGEACGLSWGDVDFEASTVLIQHAYDDFGNLKTPKTESGVRLLPLPDFMRDCLKKRKAAQMAMVPAGKVTKGYTRKLKDGSFDLEPTVPVVAGELTERIDPLRLTGWWAYHRDKFGAAGFSLHQLRHTFLSLAAEQGVHPSVMQKLAGHSSPEITMKIYTHINVEAKKAAMEAMQSAYMTRQDKAS